MSSSARYAFVALLTLLAVVAPLYAQSSAKLAAKSPRNTVSGRVTIKGKGAPGVAVGVRKSDSPNPFEPFFKGVTDQDGFYRISDVPPGSYEVRPSTPGFVSAEANGARKSLVLAENENIEDINFSLVRGGVITGKVTDTDGRAVIEQQVTLYRADAFEQRSPPRPTSPSTSAQTDDRGIYRIFGVSAGRYKVAAGRSDDVFSPQLFPTRAPYKQAFHPDVTDQAKASIIEVVEGSEANNIDITLGRAIQTFSASGRVVEGEKGSPMPNVRFGFQRINGERVEFIPNLVTSNSTGDFAVEGLIPGKYGIFLFPDPNSEVRAESISFDVIDQDVSGITVKLTKGATLSGIVILENEDKAAFGKLVQMQLQAYVRTGSGRIGFGQSATSAIAPDGSFRLAGLPNGTVNIALGGPMGSISNKGFMINRVERDGIAQARGIEIREGEQITGVRVVVTYGNATLRGVVSIENGPLPDDSRIYVQLAKPGEISSNLMPPPVDARGHFLMEGLPAGVYELSVSIIGGTGKALRAPVKRDISIQDGVVNDVAVTIDLGSTPKP